MSVRDITANYKQLLFVNFHIRLRYDNSSKHASIIFNAIIIIIFHLIFQDQFIVYEGFDGSVKYYIVSIADYVSTNSCGSANVSSSSCANNICIHIFNILDSSCALTSNISVTVYGVNVFGKGIPNTFNIG